MTDAEIHELLHEDVVEWSRAKLDRNRCEQAFNVLKDQLRRARNRENVAALKLKGKGHKFVVAGGAPERLKEAGLSFRRTTQRKYDHEEVLAEVMARGLEDLFEVPAPTLKKSVVNAKLKANELPWLQYEDVVAPSIAIQIDERAALWIVSEADRLAQLAEDGVETGELP